MAVLLSSTLYHCVPKLSLMTEVVVDAGLRTRERRSVNRRHRNLILHFVYNIAKRFVTSTIAFCRI